MQLLGAASALSPKHASLSLRVEKSRALCLNVRFNELNTAGASLACLLGCFSSAVAKKAVVLWMPATIIRMRLSFIR